MTTAQAPPPTKTADLKVEELKKEYPTPREPLTLLKILGTLDTPTSGRFHLAGTDPFSLSPTDLARFRSQSIGFVFQDHHLLPQLSALENVLIPKLALGKTTTADAQRASDLLAKV